MEFTEDYALNVNFYNKLRLTIGDNILLVIKIVSIFSIQFDRTKKLADRYSSKAYDNFEKMFKENKFDIVDICLPTYLHLVYLEKCKKYNVNIFCEKLIGLSYV